MCKYCEEHTTGDCNDSLFTKIIKMNGVALLEADVFINDDELELYIDEIRDGIQILKKKRRINYCPICGEKLAHKTTNEG